MAEDEQVKELKKLIDAITERSIDRLVHRDEWGAITFEDARTDLERLRSLVQPLKGMPLEEMPTANIRPMIDHAKSANEILEKIDEFTIETQDPRGERDQICEQLKSKVDQLYPVFAQWIPYLQYRRGDVQTNLSKLQESLVEAQKTLEEAKNFASDKQEEVDDIIQATREAAANVGVATFTQDFSGEAEKLAAQANKWLTAAIIGAIATLGATFFFLFGYSLPEDATVAQIVQQTSTKIILIAVLLTATIWCGRMFRATRARTHKI